MTTKISTILAGIRTDLGTLFASKTEIPNPYSIENNNENMLRDSWGVAIGVGSEADINVFNQYHIRYDVEVTLTKETVRKEGNVDQLQKDVLTLLEDVVTLRHEFEKQYQLNMSASIEKVELVSNSGIEFIEINKYNFIKSVTTYAFEISEDL